MARPHQAFSPVLNIDLYEKFTSPHLTSPEFVKRALESLGTYHVVIASEVLREPHRWAKVFAPEGPLDTGQRFVIMDNGVIETGEALKPEEIAAATTIVRPDAIVVPDVIDDMAATISLAGKSIPKIAREMHYPVQFLGVAQGVNDYEVVNCGMNLAVLGCEIISAPRGLTKNLGSRRAVTRSLIQQVKKPIHLLGWSDNIRDDIYSLVSHKDILGNDSATPTWLGLFNQELLGNELEPFVPLFEPGPRPLNYWNMAADEGQLEAVVHNIEVVRSWVSSAAAKLVLMQAKP